MNLMIKSNRLYDTLKFIAQILLPGAGGAYFALAQIWNLPNAEQVVGTVTVVDGFLGLFLKKSSDNYEKSEAKYDGDVLVDEHGETKIALNEHPDIAVMDEDKKELTLKVKRTVAPDKKPRKRVVEKVIEDL